MKILVIEDDPSVREALSASLALQWNDAEVLAAEDGISGLHAFFERQPDMVLLDVGLPGLGGLDVLDRVREVSDVPIVMLTAKDRETDKVRALDLGADDYVTKPCSYHELHARLRAVLRRCRVPSRQAMLETGEPLENDGLVVVPEDQQVQVDGREVALTKTEYRLLNHLMKNRGRVLTHKHLLHHVWGSELYSADVLRVYVNRLRAKIESEPSCPRYILTRPGIGYIMVRERTQVGVGPRPPGMSARRARQPNERPTVL